MKTKNLITTLLLAASAWLCQDLSAQFSFGSEAGYANNHFSTEILGASATSKQQHGFMVGGIVSYTYNDIGWLETGISLQRKGFKISTDYNFSNGHYLDFLNPINEIKVNGYSLDIPLWIGIKFGLTDHLSLIPKVGGFYSYGIKGKASFSGKDENNKDFSVEYDLPVLFSLGSIPTRELRDDYSRNDAGLQVGLDVVWKQFALRGAYKFGLKEHSFFEHEIKSRSLSVSIAYYFKQP